MELVLIRELSGRALDWAVAKCTSNPVARHNTGAIFLIDTPWADKSRVKWLAEYSPSKHWAQGGPIIERESLQLTPCEDMASWSAGFMFRQGMDDYTGPSPLVAAMRCYVASKADGASVMIPEELI